MSLDMPPPYSFSHSCDAGIHDGTDVSPGTQPVWEDVWKFDTSGGHGHGGDSRFEGESASESGIDDEHEPDIDGLELLETLGTGTFGRVYLARLNPSPTAPPRSPNPSHSNLIPHDPHRRRSSAQPQFFALKILAKATVLKLKQLEHVLNESQILHAISPSHSPHHAHGGHPFLTSLHSSFQTRTSLFMLLEFIPGGELFTHLRRAGHFPTPVAQFYAAEIVLALEFLHAHSIVYRDLKPENILLAETGHIKLTDFGFAKHLSSPSTGGRGRTWTLCGTPEYLAPEIIRSLGHGEGVDWWALGILTYEMLVGYPPFYADNPFGIYEKIIEGRVRFPTSSSSSSSSSTPHIEAPSRSFILSLLTPDLSRRLGTLSHGSLDVRRHAFFSALDWDALEHCQVRPPIVPVVRGEGDRSNFEVYEEVGGERERLMGEIRGEVCEGGVGEDEFGGVFEGF
ncbi:hypothetical protein G7K_5188-t1 [Saitoella complicata NRRL Y-17804]|uniref:cAMP-dependent protein kinase n=1 Tax=Saitoella complicata (strain BCRC 22490 / CBS 7301 / JCM 7358 / NBRC 10748 / NRRL Y-17804) TaxID=698492 RepID=A0A0E9NN15_SAICN|nr:hypothetical protein G7K_5188-t1 [Saitoella complicata NRRL Y-17804]